MKELTITYIPTKVEGFGDPDAIRATIEVKDMKEAFEIINAWPYHVTAWCLRQRAQLAH